MESIALWYGKYQDQELFFVKGIMEERFIGVVLCGYQN